MPETTGNVVTHRYYGIELKSMKGLRSKLSARLAALKGRSQCAVNIEDPVVSVKVSSKSAIIAAAVAYIEHLEAERDRTSTRMVALQNQVVDLQKVVDFGDYTILRHQEKPGTSDARVSTPSL